MRVLAAIFVAALAIVPLLGCGGSGSSCSGQCGPCFSDFDCCGSLLCLPDTFGDDHCTIAQPYSC